MQRYSIMGDRRMGVRIVRPLVHIAMIIGCFHAMISLRQVTDLIPFVQLRIPQIDTKETLLFALIAALIFVIIGITKGVYELYRPIHSYYKKFLNTRLVWVFVVGFFAYMGFGYIFVGGISRFVLVMGSVSVFVALTIIDTFFNMINTSIEKQDPYRVLILGDDETVVHEVRNTLGLYQIYRILQRGQDELNDEFLSRVDIVMVAGSIESEKLQAIADRVRIAGKLFYHASDTFFLEDLIAVPHRIGPLMAMEYSPSPLDGRRKVIKRLFDIVVSFFALIALFPILLIVGILIKLDSKGPALYKHQRVGKNGEAFTFVKFRSMYTHLSVGDQYGGEGARELKKELMDSDANVRKGELQKIENDPRVTTMGRFIRKTSLDELPSLFLVLIGTMSLVGPRPHELFEVDRYKPWQKRLLSVKPGITGYAQLFGRDSISFDEEAKLDLYYIQNRSIILDIYVLVGTVKVVLKGT